MAPQMLIVSISTMHMMTTTGLRSTEPMRRGDAGIFTTPMVGALTNQALPMRSTTAAMRIVRLVPQSAPTPIATIGPRIQMSSCSVASNENSVTSFGPRTRVG